MIAVLWIAGMVVLIAMMIGCTWMLVRKFVRLLAAMGELLVNPAILDGVHRAEPERRQVPAVLEPRAVVAARYRELARARDERKRLRATARRERALALISAKPTGLN